MPADPLARIFGNPQAPLTGIYGPKLPREEPLPHYEIDAKGHAHPINFDNDKMIQVYEENLKYLVDNAGITHPGVPDCGRGLALLYDMKAGVEKNIAYYDKAIEYMQYANQSLEKMLGRSAYTNRTYIENEKMIAKTQRKKERRVAKAASAEEVSLALPALRVTQVRLLAGGQLLFMYEDGSSANFAKPGVRSRQGMSSFRSEFSGIDDDITERYTQPPFYLDPGEFLVGMITHEKQRKGELNALCFHTSLGRRSQWFEFDTAEPRGREYSYWAAKDCHITALETKSGNVVVPCGIVEGQRGRSTS